MDRHSFIQRVSGALCSALFLSAHSAHGIDIPGIHYSAWDQPHIYFALIRPGETAPIEDPFLNDFHLRGFLDTGASGIVLDPYLHDPGVSGPGLDLPFYQYDATTVEFSDTALEGNVEYNVTESLELHLSAYHPYGYLNDTETFAVEYDQVFGPGRYQIGPVGTGNAGDPLTVIGMPAMVGKVMVVDPKYLDIFITSGFDFNLIDELHAYLYDPGTVFIPEATAIDPGIPVTDRHVQLTMVDVSRFTKIEPGPDLGPPPDPGAEIPVLSSNPFIGTNPLAAVDSSVPAGTTPGITVTEGAKNATGSFLFDTGAAFSFISTLMAESLDIRYSPGTYGTSAPVLETFDPGNPGAAGTPVAGQFQAAVSGIGGADINIAGFFMDSLSAPTLEGDPLIYVNVPLFVFDISLCVPDVACDPADGVNGIDDYPLVLDGVFGMNLLVASALPCDITDILGGLCPGLISKDDRRSPFDWIVFDEPNARLGVKIGPSVDDDYDDDGVRDYVDICPYDADPAQTNSDSDAAGDACDDLPTNSSETVDTDNDGTGDNADDDDDGDGILDVNDVCPRIADPGQENYDGDIFGGDACDLDDDNDGAADGRDALPNDATETSDADLDGTGDNVDPDDDNDGIRDALDPSPGIVFDDNACDPLTTAVVEFDNPAVSSIIWCAAKTKVMVRGTTKILDGGHLNIVSPESAFGNEFNISPGGSTSVYSEALP